MSVTNGLPTLLPRFCSADRAMNEVQIDVVKPGFLERSIHMLLRIVVTELTRRDFRGEKQLVAGNAGFQHARSGGLLVAVADGGVDLKMA